MKADDGVGEGSKRRTSEDWEEERDLQQKKQLKVTGNARLHQLLQDHTVEPGPSSA